MTLEERIKEIEKELEYYSAGKARCTGFSLMYHLRDSLSIIQELQNKNKELTRLEVIDESGRVYVNNNCKMELSYQDEGKTLKIFVNNIGVK